MKFDYEKMYASSSDQYRSYVRRTGIWKAQKLCELIKDEKTDSILEIGTGRGDVLNACHCFKRRIGADCSQEALNQQHEEYGTVELIKIDANKPLPFKANEFDFVLLCDILEHVDNPSEMLKDAARVSKYQLLKIPLENALLFRIMQKLHGVKYGAEHPSGHLHCWTLSDIFSLIESADLKLVRYAFIPTPTDLLQEKTSFKVFIMKLLQISDILTHSHFFTRIFIGGSFFALTTKK